MDDPLMATDCHVTVEPATPGSTQTMHDEREPQEVEQSAAIADDHTPTDEEPVSGPELVTGENDEAVEPAQVVEALLFASDSPLSAGRLAELVGAGTPTKIRKHIAALNEKYASADLSFRIEEVAGGFRMLTTPVYRTWLVKLNKQRQQTRLSGAALETLSIVGYKQPIIRAEIDAIRGVSSGEALNRLREMGLVKIVGRAEMVGRPMLYGTTKKFLDIFGLASLDDLPPLEALSLKKRELEEQESTDEPVEEAERRAASA
jgi:segregation and condensation protein B